MSRIGHFDKSEYGEIVQPNEFDNEYKLIENGYFFFDYEKALRNETVLSKVFNINSVQNQIGSNVVNRYFKLSEAVMDRKDVLNGFVYTKTSVFDDSLESDYPKLEETNYLNTGDGVTFLADTSYDYEGKMIYPELMLRNMHIVGNDSINAYRMMTFQFQDIMPSDGTYGNSNRDNDWLYFKVRCKDYTKQLISEMTSSYISLATGSFGEYVAAAEDFCSYNNIEGYFNDFFVEAVESNYVDNIQTAPWVVMPVAYNMHLDMVYGTFEGSMQKITDASIVLSEQIAPSTGRLENLQNFNEDVVSLINFYTGEEFSQLMEPYSNEETIEFGNHAIQINRFGLPDFLNLSAQLIPEDIADLPVKKVADFELNFGKNYTDVGTSPELRSLLSTNNFNLPDPPYVSGNTWQKDYNDYIFDWLRIMGEVADNVAGYSYTYEFQYIDGLEWSDSLEDRISISNDGDYEPDAKQSGMWYTSSENSPWNYARDKFGVYVKDLDGIRRVKQNLLDGKTTQYIRAKVALESDTLNRVFYVELYQMDMDAVTGE